jgi:hypothetical protein
MVMRAAKDRVQFGGALGSTSKADTPCSGLLARCQRRMPRSTEIKTRISSVDALSPRVALIADQGPIEITHDDTFFKCKNGRLKMRKRLCL